MHAHLFCTSWIIVAPNNADPDVVAMAGRARGVLRSRSAANTPRPTRRRRVLTLSSPVSWRPVSAAAALGSLRPIYQGTYPSHSTLSRQRQTPTRRLTSRKTFAVIERLRAANRAQIRMLGGMGWRWVSLVWAGMDRNVDVRRGGRATDAVSLCMHGLLAACRWLADRTSWSCCPQGGIASCRLEGGLRRDLWACAAEIGRSSDGQAYSVRLCVRRESRGTISESMHSGRCTAARLWLNEALPH